MTVAIIQARMGSTRLPGKVLKEVNNQPLLAYQLGRVSKASLLDKIVIATSTLEKDDTIEEFCSNNRIECFRGSENDVLSRYYECAKKYDADIIVRLTGDCPLADPEVIDSVIQKFMDDNVDYCANTVPIESSTFPDGLDVEVFSITALTKAYKTIEDTHFREHVTFQFWQTEDFKSSQFIGKEDYSSYRLTVDYPEDFEVIEYIIKQLAQENQFGTLSDVIEILKNNDTIKQKNEQYYFGQGWNNG